VFVSADQHICQQLTTASTGNQAAPGALTALLKKLSYDSATGSFTWVQRSRNQLEVGTEAGSLDSQGYRRICLGGKFYKAHRLAWFITHGEMPPIEIDHINGIRDDNRIANLRLVDRFENMQNCIPRPNKSGFAGVKSTGKRWVASIRVKGALVHLGLFDAPEIAAKAYIDAKRKYHPSFAR